MSIFQCVPTHRCSNRSGLCERAAMRSSAADRRQVCPWRTCPLDEHRDRHSTDGAVAGLVEIECGVVSGVINLESSGVEAPDWRPRHDKQYHAA